MQFSELESWRKWAKASGNQKTYKSIMASNLQEAKPQKIDIPNRSTLPGYSSCSSCKRWR